MPKKDELILTEVPEHRTELAGWYVGGEVVFSNAPSGEDAPSREGVIIDVVKFDGQGPDVTYSLFRVFKIGGRWVLSHDKDVVIPVGGPFEESFLQKLDDLLGSISKGLE